MLIKIKHVNTRYKTQTWFISKVEDLAFSIKSGTGYLSKPVETLIAITNATNTTSLLQSSKNQQRWSSLDHYQGVFTKKLERIRLHTCLAVDKVNGRKSVHTVIEMLDDFEETSDQILQLCQKLVKGIYYCLKYLQICILFRFNKFYQWGFLKVGIDFKNCCMPSY